MTMQRYYAKKLWKGVYYIQKVPPNEGIEPSTTRLRVVRSTN